MTPEKRRELQARAQSIAPPAVAPPQMAQQFQTMPDGTPVASSVKIKSYGHKEANVQAIHPSMAAALPAGQANGVRVRGAQVVEGAQTGASVTMQGAQRQSGVRGARMIETSVAPSAPPPPYSGRIPLPQPASMPNTPWMGQPPSSAEVTAAPKPIVNLTVILAQRSRPHFLERQRRAIDASTVRPAAIECHINPVGVQLNDRLLQGIPTQRESVDKGPWMRWRMAQETVTKYVLVIDDDCIPGMNWMRAALERLERAESLGEKIVVCAAGLVYVSDDVDDAYPLGPEGPRLTEEVADGGRGAWLLPRDLLSDILDFPRDLFSTPSAGRVAVPLLIAAALQENGYRQIVLPYSPAEKSGWGMLDAPTYEGSTSHMIDVQAKAGADYPASWYRQDVYAKLRATGWEPMCVVGSAETAQLSADEFGTAPSIAGPAPAPMPSKATAKAESQASAE